jgi:dTDP-4-dehydrorhamnose 3,5-epimerase
VRFHETSVAGAYLIELELREDERGYNARVWCRSEFEAQGLTASIAQSNTIYNRRRGTLRGMHYQAPPHEEAKVFRVTRGAIHDVIVDVRPGSPTYGSSASFRLSADEPTMLFVPEGCAQGFQTLVDDTEVAYQTSAMFAPESGRGFRYDDPAFGLEWPLAVTVISRRDREWPDFEPLQPPAGPT